MRIAFIGQNEITTNSAGIRRHVREIAERMAEQGHDVFLYGQRLILSKKQRKLAHIHLVKIPDGNSFLRDIFSIIHILKDDYDVIHYVPKEAGLLGWAVKKMQSKAVLVSMEDLQCPFNIKNSKPTKSILRPPGISKWGLRDKRYVLFAGELKKNAGVHYLIEAFKHLEDTAKTPNNFKLIIIGGGDDYDFISYLKLIAHGRSNIIFAGIPSKESMNQLHQHAYLFVQPSESGISNIELLRAMSHGTASLVSDIKENSEAIDNGGFSFESKSIKSLQERLAYLLNRTEEVKRAGTLAKKYIESEYSCDSVAKKTLKTYKQLMITK